MSIFSAVGIWGAMQSNSSHLRLTFLISHFFLFSLFYFSFYFSRYNAKRRHWRRTKLKMWFAFTTSGHFFNLQCSPNFFHGVQLTNLLYFLVSSVMYESLKGLIMFSQSKELVGDICRIKTCSLLVVFCVKFCLT